MNFNNTQLEKYYLYKRLLKRWKRLPDPMIRDIAMNHQVQEEILDRVAIDNFNRAINDRRKRN